MSTELKGLLQENKIAEKQKFGMLPRALISFFVMIVLLTVVAHAWITSNRQVASGDMDMSLIMDDTTASYLVYRYDIAAGACVTTDNEGNALDISNLDFNQYDTIFKSYNKYTPMIIKIDVVRLSVMPTSGRLTLTVSKKTDGEYTDPDCVSSKVMRFALTVPDVGTTTDPGELYSLFEEELYEPLSNADFNYEEDYTKTLATATVDGNGEYVVTSADSIVLYADYDEADWQTDSYGNQTLTAYLYVMYDAALVSIFQSDIEIGDGSLSANVISVENDLKKIAVGYLPSDDS